MPTAKRPRSSLESTSTTSTKQATVSVKSLRPPKFNVTVSASYADTVFTLKEKIASEAKISGSVKLLLKGKVISDTKAVEEIVDEQGKASLMAMVTAAEETPAEQIASAPLPEPAAIDLEINADVWGAIESTLVGKFGDAKAKLVMERLQKGYTLAKN